MEKRRYILCLLIGFVCISCTKAPVFQETLVPEIVSITSIPETHSAILMSDLNTAPFGRIECGFYYGTDKTNLRRVETALAGKSFIMLLEDLQEGTTYYFKAFISNGVNEIASGFESFITDTEPVEPVLPVEPDNPEQPIEPDQPEDPEQEEPEVPVEPEQPEDPEPEEPEVPVEPEQPTDPEPEDPQDPGQDEPEQPEEPGPDDPEEPGQEEPTEPEPEDPEPEDPVEPEDPGQEEPEDPVEFTTEITDLSAMVNDYIAELTAGLSGDASLVKECWFMVGYTPDKLSKIKGKVEGNCFKAYLAGLESGTYHYKAVITDGTETKESELCSFSF